MPRSSRRDSSSIIPSQHQAQSFVITSCISQFTSQITAFLAFPSTIRSKRSNSWSLHQCESFHVLPSILRYFFSIRHLWWSTFIHFWKVSKVWWLSFQVVTCFTSSKQPPFFPHLHLSTCSSHQHSMYSSTSCWFLCSDQAVSEHK
jgi:hypothetical protein